MNECSFFRRNRTTWSLSFFFSPPYESYAIDHALYFDAGFDAKSYGRAAEPVAPRFLSTKLRKSLKPFILITAT